MASLAGEYRRREPEQGPLHQVVREHLRTFLEEVEQAGGVVPARAQRG